MKKSFEIWIIKNARKNNGNFYSESTAKKYASSIDMIKREFGIDFWNCNDIYVMEKYKTELLMNERFVVKNILGNHMYSCAIDMYIKYKSENR